MKIPPPLKEVAAVGGGLCDNYGRPINYLRLAITDRCNLRCRYCRPESGVPFVPHDEILRFEELERLAVIFCRLGITKLRLTGGEPFSRRGFLPFLKRLRKLPGLKTIHITTNGVRVAQFLDELVRLGVDGINLSLDTLDPVRFRMITRRDYLAAVLETMRGVLACDIPLKINSVVLGDTTDEEIVSLAGLAERHPLTLRFIERMPFSGTIRAGGINNGDLVRRLRNIFPRLRPIKTPRSGTARVFRIPGFKGDLGVIQGHSRSFCATCNKVRITPVGMLKTCLYDNGVLDLRQIIREGADDHEIAGAVIDCVGRRFADGLEAERVCSRFEEPAMSLIGG